MKNVLSLVLCFLMLLVPVAVSAEESAEDLPPVMGDVNLDGKVSAADARRVLRISAFLEGSEGISLLSADADGNGKFTAADARLILRKGANLGEFTYGFAENGVSNSLKAISGDRFILGVSVEDMSFELVMDGANMRVLGADLGDDFAALGMSECGIMFCDDKLYMTYKSNGSDVAMFIPAELYDKMGISVEDITSLAQSITMFIPADAGIPEKQEVDGETVYVYNVENNGIKSKIFTDSYGIIKSIEGYDEKGEYVDTITVTKVGAQVDSSWFDLSKFELI